MGKNPLGWKMFNILYFIVSYLFSMVWWLFTQRTAIFEQFAASFRFSFRCGRSNRVVLLLHIGMMLQTVSAHIKHFDFTDSSSTRSVFWEMPNIQTASNAVPPFGTRWQYYSAAINPRGKGERWFICLHYSKNSHEQHESQVFLVMMLFNNSFIQLGQKLVLQWQKFSSSQLLEDVGTSEPCYFLCMLSFASQSRWQQPQRCSVT